MLAVNPYWGSSFGAFFLLLFSRLKQLLFGELSWNELAPDEIQLAVLVLIVLSSTLIGTFLVLTRMTMVANALSHTILLGIALSFILHKANGHSPMLNLSTLLIAALFSSVLTIGAIELLRRGAHLQRDASIGLVFTTFFALGVLLISVAARHSHLGTEAIMGNIDALHRTDISYAAFLLVINALVVLFLFKRWKIAAFDPMLARSFGLSIFLLEALLLFQTATTAVISFRAVGVFLFLAFLVVPFTAARFLVKRLKAVMAVAMALGTLTAFIAVALARHLLSVHHLLVSTAGLIALLLILVLSASIGVRTTLQRLLNRGARER